MPTKGKAKRINKKPSKNYVLPPGKSLGLRTCNADLSSASEFANGFKWPKSGPVKCPDWDPAPHCGNGLHLLPFGEGARSLLDFSDNAKWLVVEYDTKKAVILNGKIKIPYGVVIFCGTKDTATKWLQEHAGKSCSVVGSTNTGGYGSTNTGGDRSTNTGGDSSTNTGGHDSTNTGGPDSTNTGGYGSTNTGGYGSTNTGGDRSTNTGGPDSTNTGGYGSTNTGGYGSTNTGGDRSTNTGGDSSTNTGGPDSTNTGGYDSTNTGGDRSTNTGGDSSTNTGGHDSTCKSGDLGAIAIWWWDYKANRRRLTVGYVGEDGIEPDTFYRCDSIGHLIKVS